MFDSGISISQLLGQEIICSPAEEVELNIGFAQADRKGLVSSRFDSNQISAFQEAAIFKMFESGFF